MNMKISDKFSAVIFDLDGVLVDTSEFHYQGWKKVADDLDIPFDRKKNERLKGVPRMRSLEIILEDCQQKPENMEKLATNKNQHYQKLVDTLTPADLFEGVIEVFEKLREKQIKIGLGSSSKNAKIVIDKLDIGEWFDAIVDGNDCKNAKPAPDLFLLCAEKLGKKPEDCVVIEDAQAGIDAAKKGAMFAIGVDAKKRLQNADILVDSVADLTI